MKKLGFLAFIVLLVGLDQFSKIWALSQLMPYQSQRITTFFNFTLAFNTGAAFSFLSQAGAWHRWFFAGFSLVMSLGLGYWLFFKTQNKQMLQSWALSFILGGALGNFIDRARAGVVVDFIDLHLNAYHWPIFNVADSFICIGAILLFFALNEKKT